MSNAYINLTTLLSARGYDKGMYFTHEECSFLFSLINARDSRIAELEGLVNELKPYRDGYDPEEAFPPEGEWVWLRDCDDNIEIMGYSQKEKCYWNYEGSRMPDDGDIVRWYPIGKLPEEREE